jgi:hypothetical protein
LGALSCASLKFFLKHFATNAVSRGIHVPCVGSCGLGQSSFLTAPLLRYNFAKREPECLNQSIHATSKSLTTTWPLCFGKKRRPSESQWPQTPMKRRENWRLLEFATIILIGPKVTSTEKWPGGCLVKQIEFLRFVIDVLERLDISYAVVGSYASSAWGEPRMTRDIDVIVELSGNQVAALCDAFSPAEFYVSPVAARDAVERRSQFNVIHPSSGNKVDFIVAGKSDWSIVQLRRRKQIQFDENTCGYVASPEDVILGKLLYLREGGSEKHIRDITGILKIRKDPLDLDYIASTAAQLRLSDVWQSIVENVK